MIPIATTSRICEHLEKYVYDRIWNEPYTESRMYTVPGIISPVDKHVVTVDGEPTTVVQYTPASGYLSGRYSKILLPPFNSEEDLKAWLPSSATKFFVYAIPDRFFSAAKVGVPRWTLLSDYCTDRCLDLHVFTESGVILNRGAIYIKQARIDQVRQVHRQRWYGRQQGLRLPGDQHPVQGPFDHQAQLPVGRQVLSPL